MQIVEKDWAEIEPNLEGTALHEGLEFRVSLILEVFHELHVQLLQKNVIESEKKLPKKSFKIIKKKEKNFRLSFIYSH